MKITIIAEANRIALEKEGMGKAEAYNKIMQPLKAHGLSATELQAVMADYITTGNFAKLDKLTTLIIQKGEVKDKTSLIIQPK